LFIRRCQRQRGSNNKIQLAHQKQSHLTETPINQQFLIPDFRRSNPCTVESTNSSRSQNSLRHLAPRKIARRLHTSTTTRSASPESFKLTISPRFMSCGRAAQPFHPSISVSRSVVLFARLEPVVGVCESGATGLSSAS